MLVTKAKNNDHSELAEQGFFILRQAFARADIAAMRERLDAIIQGNYAKQGRRFQLETESGNYNDVEHTEIGYRGPNVPYRKIADLEYDEVFLSCLQRRWIEDICTEVMGDTVSIMRVTMMNKQAKGGTPLPWHQDISLNWPMDVQPQLAMWFPLDPATEDSGSVQVIPGSHRHGIIGRGHLLPAELEPHHAPAEKVVTAELQPGDCLFFHAGTLHRSGLNRSETQRRAINAILIPGRAMHTKRHAPYPLLFGEGALTPFHVATLTAIPQ